MLGKGNCLQLTDEDLAAKTLADQSYYYCLVERYENPLKRYIRRLTDISDSEIEDVLQNVLLKAYLNLNDFDSRLKFSSWLYRIAHNETISNYRKRQARHQDEQVAIDDQFDLVDNSSIEVNFDIKLTKAQLARVLKKMSEKYREVLILKFLEEKSYEEISDILQKPMGTIATLVNRAKKQFRLIVSREGIKF